MRTDPTESSEKFDPRSCLFGIVSLDYDNNADGECRGLPVSVEVVAGERWSAGLAVLQAALGTPRRRHLRGKELEQARRLLAARYAVCVTSLCSASYARWRRGTARIRPLPYAALPCAEQQSINIAFRLGPQQQTCTSEFAGVGQIDRQTERQTDRQTDGRTDRRTDTRQLHRPCFA